MKGTPRPAGRLDSNCFIHLLTPIISGCDRREGIRETIISTVGYIQIAVESGRGGGTGDRETGTDTEVRGGGEGWGGGEEDAGGSG